MEGEGKEEAFMKANSGNMYAPCNWNNDCVCDACVLARLSNDCCLGVVAACNSVATNCREQHCVRATARVKNCRFY